jgi:hypothetical protein
MMVTGTQPLAEQPQPLTALALLTGRDQRGAEAIAHGPLSVVIGGSLGTSLSRLPKLTREAAVGEVLAATAGLLDISLIGALVTGWREHHDLTSAARRTLAVADSTELVQLVAHQIRTTQQPSVTVLVDGTTVATVDLGLCLVFDLTGVLAVVSSGRLCGLHSGRCDITGTLAVQGVDLLTKQARLELPGLMPLGRGVRLLPAQDYPVGAEPADAADDIPAQQGAAASAPPGPAAPARPGPAGTASPGRVPPAGSH